MEHYDARLGPLAEQIKTLLTTYSEELSKQVQKHKRKPKLSELAQFYAGFYIDLKGIEALAEQVREHKTYLAEKLIPKIMDSEGINSVNLDMGYRVTGTARLFVSIKDKDAAYQWLRENGHGDLIQETVNAQTLAALGRELEDEGEELDETYFNVNTRDNTTVAKLPKRKTA